MAFLPALAPILTAAAAVGSTAYLIASGGPKVPTAPPQISLNNAQAAQNQQDALLQRRGGASDFLNGDNGAMPTLPGPKQLLGS